MLIAYINDSVSLDSKLCKSFCKKKQSDVLFRMERVFIISWYLVREHCGTEGMVIQNLPATDFFSWISQLQRIVVRHLVHLVHASDTRQEAGIFKASPDFDRRAPCCYCKRTKQQIAPCSTWLKVFQIYVHGCFGRIRIRSYIWDQEHNQTHTWRSGCRILDLSVFDAIQSGMGFECSICCAEQPATHCTWQQKWSPMIWGVADKS